MNELSKLQLSQEEMELVNNTEWILTKHAIIKKVYEMFGYLNDSFIKEASLFNYLFDKDLKNKNGKISRGENYQLLPYLILDYPNHFEKNNIFAVRTMFWWGNFFSVTLHTSGNYKTKVFTDNIHDVLSFLQKNNFFICINEDEWQHHFNEDNYVPATQITLQQFEEISKKYFIKISKKILVAQWDHANEFIINTFREIMQLLNINYQAGKKDLLPGFPKAGSGL